MDLDRIREFHTLAKTLNFTQAARGLNISVSALSKHIQALENELGVRLLSRNANGSQGSLTEAGKAFYNETGPWLEEFEGIVGRCRELRQPEPPVRIDGVSTCILNVTSQISHALDAQGRPRVSLACLGTTLPAREALDKKTADFACYYEPVPEVRWIEKDTALKEAYGYVPLAPERLCVIVGKGNALYDQNSAMLSQLEQFQDVVMSDSLYNNWLKAKEELLRKRGCSLSFKFESDMPLYGGAFPLGTSGISIVPAKFAEYYLDLDVEDVKILDIEGEPLVLYPFLIYRKDAASASAQEIVEAFEAQKILETA